MPPPSTPAAAANPHLATPGHHSVDVPDDASASGGALRRQPSIRDRMRLFEQRAAAASVSDTPAEKRSVGSLPREMTARIEAQMDMASMR
jgi:hypothetical protein